MTMPFMPVPEANGHPEPPNENDPSVAMMLQENFKLKTWLVGVLEGCDGCRGEALAWAGLMGLVHEKNEVESES